MPAAPGNRSAATHRAVVALAHDYIAAQGLPVKSYPRPTRLMDIGEEIHPDLDAAVGVANLSGSPVGAVLQWRSDRPIAESYAVLRLVDLIALVQTARANIAAAP